MGFFSGFIRKVAKAIGVGRGPRGPSAAEQAATKAQADALAKQEQQLAAQEKQASRQEKEQLRKLSSENRARRSRRHNRQFLFPGRFNARLGILDPTADSTLGV